MDLKQIFSAAHDKILKSADVQFVFGEMIEAKGKSIIPVSAIRYSLGGGMGKGPDLARIKGISNTETEGETKENRPGGEGVGGRFSNNPLGVFEIKEDSTRFVPVVPVKEIVVMITIWIVTRLFRRKKK